MSRAQARLEEARYRVAITAGGHAVTADEPPALGGGGTGPAPYDLLLAALGACTAITLRMYAERKGWMIGALEVSLHYVKTEDGAHIDRVLHFDAALDADQRRRLAEIAEKTPVTLTLKSGLPIATSVD